MTYREDLGNGLVLRSVEDGRDIQRFVDFNSTYNGAEEGQTCDCLLRHHPGVILSDFWLVENEKTGEVISTTCLIPWTCRYGETALRTAMLEMVLTHPAYRGQGLVRAQVRHFLQEVQARGFDLSIIWGIPYYYRQYGYGYALEGDTYESLPAWRIPDDPSGKSFPYRLRSATLEDINCLHDLYLKAVAPLQVCVLRDAPYWEYLLRWANFPVEILDNEHSGKIAGYVAYTRLPGRQGVRLLESNVTNAEAGLALLRAFKAQAQGEVLIAWPENNALVQLARSLGSQTMPGGQWLLRIPDMPRFLRKISPELESRLANSAWQDLTMDLIINLYREAYKLRFAAGKLAAIEPLGFVDSSMGADGGHLCIPPDAFLRLVCGYRSLEQLRDAWPDRVAKPEIRSLIDALFPRMASYLHTPYHYKLVGLAATKQEDAR